ncbi:hypothetical protein OAS86_07215 [Gammaproteobacteria bacterium]|nr:hypothetical protein [Gammaproteobacteria bacterium]
MALLATLLIAACSTPRLPQQPLVLVQAFTPPPRDQVLIFAREQDGYAASGYSRQVKGSSDTALSAGHYTVQVEDEQRTYRRSDGALRAIHRGQQRYLAQPLQRRFAFPMITGRRWLAAFRWQGPQDTRPRSVVQSLEVVGEQWLDLARRRIRTVLIRVTPLENAGRDHWMWWYAPDYGEVVQAERNGITGHERHYLIDVK